MRQAYKLQMELLSPGTAKDTANNPDRCSKKIDQAEIRRPTILSKVKMHSQTVGRLRHASDAFSEEQRAAGELGRSAMTPRMKLLAWRK